MAAVQVVVMGDRSLPAKVGMMANGRTEREQSRRSDTYSIHQMRSQARCAN